MTEDEVIELFDRCSNIGRWGPDDELGTLNHITPGKRLAALSTVRAGRTLSLASTLSPVPSLKNARPFIHRMLEPVGDPLLATSDEFDMAVHGFSITHLDALGHVYFEGRAWSGHSTSDVVGDEGLRYGSVLALAHGIVTRAVLSDVAAARGVDWLSPGEGVTPQDLDAVEDRAGLKVETGDVVLVRVGLGARERVQGDEDPQVRAGSGSGVPHMAS